MLGARNYQWGRLDPEKRFVSLRCSADNVLNYLIITWWVCGDPAGGIKSARLWTDSRSRSGEHETFRIDLIFLEQSAKCPAFFPCRAGRMTDIAMALSHETHEICPFKLHDSLLFKALECPWIWHLFMLTLSICSSFGNGNPRSWTSIHSSLFAR